MRQILLAALLLLPGLAIAETASEAPPRAERDMPVEAGADAAPAPQAPPSSAAFQAPAPEPQPSPLGPWALRGFLNGGAVTLSQSPHEKAWRIRTGAVEIVLHPDTREATVAGEPLPWPALPLVPAAGTPLQPGPEMPERACRFWIQESSAGTHAWCWDAAGRPQRILHRQGEQWRLVFDAETRETASLWRLLHAVGR